MNRSINTIRPTLMLAVALAAGLLVQDIASAQGRRSGMQRGGQRTSQASRRGNTTRQSVGRTFQNGVRRGMSGNTGASARPDRHPLAQRPRDQRPATRPAGKRPASSRPARPEQRPTTRPARPGIKPGTPSVGRPFPRPNTKPLPRPGSQTRPETRPLPRPGARPAPRPGTKPGGSATRPLPRPGLNTKPDNKPLRPGGLRPTTGWQQKQRVRCFQGSYYDCLRRCDYVRRQVHLHWRYQDWCGYYPVRCHWWYDWCGSGYYFDPTCCLSYNWYYCPVRVVSQGVVRQYSWHLGVNCVLIPGRGLGIQEVQAGSPAALAGLEPGMVITQANGVDLLNDEVMPSLIRQSGGILSMIVVRDASEETFRVEVQMQRLVSSSF